jgi:hypothetical protein
LELGSTFDFSFLPFIPPSKSELTPTFPNSKYTGPRTKDILEEVTTEDLGEDYERNFGRRSSIASIA